MLKIFDDLREINMITTLLRLLLAVILGGAIGLERSYKNRPAGFRTHILVCIGATIASMTGIFLYMNMHISTDISRMGAQVVSGLGFIGGGTIIVLNNKKIKGLTTAAGLWACGIIGLANGAGFYEGAVLATGLVLLAETYFSVLGSKIPHNRKISFIMQYSNKNALNDVMRYCKDNRMSIENIEVTGKSDSQASSYTAVLTVRPRKKTNSDDLFDHISQISGVNGIKGF